MFGSLDNGETQMARKNRSPKAVWQQALGDLALGGRSTECVRAFDGLTNDMFRASLIDFDEFLSAQTVIGAAYAGATQKVAA